MRTLKSLIATFILLSFFNLAANATARVQVIHNSADLAAATVDVWLDDVLLIDDFSFRTASPFIDAPSGVEFTIAIQPSNSTSPDNPLWSQNYTLEDGETYILIANGIVSPSGYDPATPFDIYVYGMGREMASDSSNTDVLVFHGSTDAPTVDVVEIGVGAGTIIDDLSYGEYAGYLELPTADYVLDIRDETGQNSVVAYDAPLATLGLYGEALVTVASGFLAPENNSEGPAFGLWVALPSGGTLVELPVHQPTARVQVIHNSADLAAETVDVWLDDVLLLDDFMFRTASPFVDAPADQEFTISIQPPSSTSPDNPLWSQNYMLEDGETYILIANGIVSPSGYDPATPFNIYVNTMGREMASNPSNTDVLVFHGSTDAPTVDVVEIGVGAGTIVDDLSYGEYAGYLELPTDDYILDIRDETGQNSVVAYNAPLETLGLQGEALVTVASGFLAPENNSDGPAFGLWVALPAGGNLVELPVYEPTARVQVIHNSADLAAETVDVWLDDVLLLDDFMFRTASPFIDAPAGQEFTISIQPPTSTSPDNPLWSQNYTLEDGETYVLVANGIVSASGYDPATPFDIYVYGMGREMASDSSNTDVLVFHGSTDAPTVDVVEIGVGAGTIVDNLAYGNFDGYLELPTNDYVLDIRDESGQNSVIAFDAPLATLGLYGEALVTVASGFLAPENNSDGPGFGLWVALPTGGNLVELPVHVPTARVQVIHNSADMAAETVDVWLNDALLLDDFMFRTASPFVDAPAGEEFTISIQPPSSTSPDDPIWSQNYTLEDGETYILIASGIVSPSGYDPATPFDIYVYGMGREMASDTNNTDVLVFHGSTDAPTVDVVEIGVGAGTIVDDLAYGEYAGYLELPTDDYILDIRDETGENSVVSYSVPLETLGLDGASLVAVASGFLNPDNNSDGEPFGLWAALPTGGALVDLPEFEAGTARVQVIHNSADAAAASVDVWINDVLALDNFAFRTATPFIDLPSGININIAIKGPDSENAEDPIWSQNYNLEDGETYVLVANGIVSPSGYDPNQPFDIYVYGMGREMASEATNTDVLVFHGSTDAPTVDVVEIGQGAGTIVDDLMYGDFQGYLELPTANYVLDIRDESGQNSVVAYQAPLADLGLDGAALVTVASGFLNPANNSDGAPFGLWVALPAGGELVELPVYEPATARVQVIHNSADAAAAVVDVWLDETLLLDDFAFRTASPFVDAPAGQEFTISIKGPDSEDPNDPIWSQQYTLEENETYILIAGGIVSASGYDPNTPFDIYVYEEGREMATTESSTDVLVFHGSTDAPVVDVVEIGVGYGTIVDDLAYGDYQGYLGLPVLNYVLDIRDETGQNSVAAYQAPFADLGLGGVALVAVASGFLNPANNSDGAGFGLWAALPSGGALVELPAYEPQSARVQVIHNSADAAAAVVDVWLNETLLLDDFAFRTASPFVDAPAGQEFTISIKGPDSEDPNDPIWSQNYTLEEDETYVLVANGIVSPSGYDPNQPFDIYVYGMGRESASNGNNVDVLVFHGSTDAPTVDVIETGQGAGTIVDDLSYGDFAGYLELPTADYQLSIADETGANVVAVFLAPLETLGLQGAALTVVASGFLNTGNNSDGAGFGLWAAAPTGGALVELPNVTSVEENLFEESSFVVYPNPSSGIVNINYDLTKASNVSISVYDITGSVVQHADLGRQQDQMNQATLDISSLNNGLYFVRVQAGQSVITRRIQVIN
ncbi:MAG: DUF4397 domain-containing protein [bacterium]